MKLAPHEHAAPPKSPIPRALSDPVLLGIHYDYLLCGNYLLIFNISVFFLNLDVSSQFAESTLQRFVVGSLIN